MPNRIIREAILSSEKMALLGWPEEVFYRRLMSIVDDYGRCEANPQLLRARCYPLQTDAVRAADISRWMAACQKAGLILCYEASGKCYLEVLNFQQQQRSASKYPAPPSSAIACNHLLADAHLVVSVSGVVSEVEGGNAAAPSGARAGYFDEFWKAYPNKVGKDAARKAFDKRKVTQELLGQMLAAIATQRQSKKWTDDGGRYIPHPSTWLNEGRWQDEGVQGVGATGSTDPDSRPAIEAEGIEKGLGPWDGIEQFHLYKARVRGPRQPGLGLDALAAMARQRQEVH